MQFGIGLIKVHAMEVQFWVTISISNFKKNIVLPMVREFNDKLIQVWHFEIEIRMIKLYTLQ